MAVESFLPPVVTRLSMNIDDFAGGVAKAKALLGSLQDKIDIPLTLDTAAAQASATALRGTLDAVTQSERDLAGAIRDTNTALLYHSAAFDSANSSVTSMSRRLSTASAWQVAFKNAVQDTNGALYRQQAALGAANLALPAGVLGGAAAAAGGAGRWFTNPTVWHWIISGSAEILAVTVPALFALGAAAADAAEGFGWMYEHMEAVYTTSEATNTMFGKTAGNLVGLKSYLQQAQTAMDPATFSMLGSGMLIAASNAGILTKAGEQVDLTFQTFAAKVSTEFGPNGSMTRDTGGLLAHMASDLSGIGQLFGNLGHFLLSFANQMPGLAEILLKVFADIAGGISWLVQLSDKFRIAGFSILTLAMSAEEFIRWGGLLTTIFVKLGIAQAGANAWTTKSALTFARLDEVMRGLWGILPRAIAGLATLAGGVGLKGLNGGLNDMADEIGMGISSLSTWQLALVTAGAVGLGFLIDKLVTARDSTQEFTDALQANIEKASNVNVLNAISTAIGQIQQRAAATSKTITVLANQFSTHAGVYQTTQSANPALGELHQGLTQQQQDLENVAAGASYLANTYKTSFTGALALADLANVKLTNGILGSGSAAVVARAQIASLVQGYEAMSQPAGAIGGDVLALGIQSGLAASKVSQLNSAWDDFMTNLTGGTGGLGSFVNSLANIGNVVATAKNNLGAAANISLSIPQFAQALTSFSGTGAQAWQNFDQVVGSTAPQIIDWLRTAGAEGAVSGGQFTKAVLGMVGSLTPFAAKSATAQAELLGLVQEVDPSVKTWSQLQQVIKTSGANLNTTQGIIESATQKMGNMAAVAQQLGDVLRSAVVSAMSSAEINASGVTKAMQIFDQTLMNGTADTKAGSAARAALIGDLRNLGYSAQQAQKLLAIMQGQINGLHGKTVTVTTIMNAVNGGSSAGPYSNGYVMSGSSRRGYASGTSGASPGWGWVGEAGPELVRFRGGETVIPSHVARGYAGGTGDSPEIHNHFYVDGREITNAVSKRSVERQRRTGSNGLTKRTR